MARIWDRVPAIGPANSGPFTFGADIPITARIISVVDCFDSLREDRPFRRGMTLDELRSLIATPWTRRGDRYSELRSSLHAGEQPLRKIEMYYIGG